MGLLTLAGKALAKRGTEVSKVAPKRTEKFMGMAEEVQPLRISNKAAEEAKKEGGKAAIAAGVGAAAGAGYLASRGGDEEKASTRSEKSSDKGDDRGEERVESKRSSGSSKPSTFGAAFKEARADGKATFTYEGKKYTTELASEKSSNSTKSSKASTQEQGVREGRNENISDDTRARAMEYVKGEETKLAKGGMVMNKGIGASMKPHNVFKSKK